MLKKYILISVLALALIVGVGAYVVNAALTLDALTITSDGVLTLTGVGTGTTSATAGIGLTANTTSTIVLGGPAQTGAINIADPASTGISTINIGTNARANVITIGSTTGAASLALKAGSGGVVVTGVLTATSPVFTTPTLGVATGTSFQGIIGNVTPAAGTFTTLTTTGNILKSVANTLTAVGTTQADALALTADFNVVTVGATTTGVKLPAAVAGMDITVRNSVGNTIHIYSAAAETLNGTAGSTGLNLDASLGTRCVAMSTSAWICNKIGAIED